MKKTISVPGMLAFYNIENNPSVERSVGAILTYLNYMPVGNQLQTSTLKFHKIADDLIMIESKVTKEDIVDDLLNTKIIKIGT